MNYTFYVEAMHCENCKEKIMNVLGGLAEVNDVSIDLDRRRVEVTSDAAPRILLKALDDAGYDARMNEER